MPVTILGITLGGEAARRKEAANSYAIKYPISGDANALRQNLGRATIELTNIKAEAPQSASDKRTQQRNITALTMQTINLQNAINDANMYMGSGTNNFTIKLPKFNSKSPYDSGTNNTPSTALVPKPVKKAKNVRGLDKPIKEEQLVDNTDGGEPQVGGQPQGGAKGDYPPPKGVQGSNYGKWIGIGALVAGVGTLGYVFLKKNN